MRSTVALLLLAVAFLAACRGSGQGGAIPNIKGAKSERDVADGAAKLTSTITVRFDRSVELAPGKVPLASHFELLVPDARQGRPAKRVLVSQAALEAGNSRLITLHVDSLVTEGTVLTVAKRAFQAGAEGELSADVEADLSPEAGVLASAALEPTRLSVFEPVEAPPPTDADRDAATQRKALEALLERRALDAEVERAALSRFDAIPAEIVPSTKLRAALAALTGTFAEPAVDYLLTSENCTGKPAALIAFQPPPNNPRLVARSTAGRDGRRVISLNPSTESARIEHLATILAHEAIHCDSNDGRFEEVAATAFDTFLYLEFVAADPEIAASKTPLARELNVDVVAMVNSGRLLPESLGILRSAGVARALPGTLASAASFFDLVVTAYPQIDQNDSPEEPLARRYMDGLVKRAGMKSGQVFNLRYLDELLGRAADTGALAAAIVVFGLTPN